MWHRDSTDLTADNAYESSLNRKPPLWAEKSHQFSLTTPSVQVAQFCMHALRMTIGALSIRGLHGRSCVGVQLPLWTGRVLHVGCQVASLPVRVRSGTVPVRWYALMRSRTHTSHHHQIAKLLHRSRECGVLKCVLTAVVCLTAGWSGTTCNHNGQTGVTYSAQQCEATGHR